MQSLDEIVSNNAKVQTDFDQNNGPDFDVENHGSIFLLRPRTKRGSEWIETNVPEGQDCIHFGGAVVIEPRYLANIVEGIRADGLEVL
jgi:hypothetical protein